MPGALWGSASEDVNDTIDGGDGNDVIFAGQGNDVVQGGVGQDFILADAGRDSVHAGAGNDFVSGGPDADLLFGDNGNDLIVGGFATDTDTSPTGQSTAARNSLIADAFAELVLGPGSTAEKLLAFLQARQTFVDAAGTLLLDTNDDLYGGAGNDLLIGDTGSDRQFGGYGNDVILGYRIGDPDPLDPEHIEGGPDDDFLCGASGVDQIVGGVTDNDFGGSILSGLLDALSQTSGTVLSGGWNVASCSSAPVPDTVAVGKIEGRLFNDQNNDGLRDARESTLEGWTVNLTDAQGAVVATTITDGDGRYGFFQLYPGDYRVDAVSEPGWHQTTAGGSSLLDIERSPEASYAISADALYAVNNEGQWELRGGFGSVAMSAIVWANGRLHGIGDSDGKFYEIDPLTAGLQKLATTGVPARGGMVFSVADQSFFLSSGNTLFRFDLGTQQTSVIGSHQTDALFGLQWSSDGDLVAARGAGVFYRIDPAHGNAQQLLGVTESDLGLAGISFSKANTVPTLQSDSISVVIRPGQMASPDQIGMYLAPTVVNGVKFHDRNANGQQDSGEEGIDGWTIILYDDQGNEIASTVTREIDGVHGAYEFKGLAPGAYSVAEAMRPDWVQTTPTLGSPGAPFIAIADDGYSQTTSDLIVENEPHPVAMVHLTLNLQHAQPEQLTLALISAAGTRITLPALAGSTLDTMLSGFAGEQPNGTWTLVVADTVQGDAGRLLDWSLQFSNGSGTQPPGGSTPSPVHRCKMTASESIVVPPPGPTGVVPRITVYFGAYRLGSVSGVKFLDSNANGLRDPEEIGLGGVEIYVDLNRNGSWDRQEPKSVTEFDNAATTEDEAGRYLLVGLPPSTLPSGSLRTYDIREIVPPGYFQTTPQLMGAHTITIASGGHVDDRDFGNQVGDALGSIHGQKWHDVDGDGFRCNAPPFCDEPGLNGWTIEFYQFDSATMTQTLVATATTMSMDLNGDGLIDPVTEQGLYWIDNLPFGDYIVREQQQPGWRQTYPHPIEEYFVTVNGVVTGLDFGNTQTGGMAPDFDADGVADCDDLDLLYAALMSGSQQSQYDLNGDGIVDYQDVITWLEIAYQFNHPNSMGVTYLPGDANLDGFVDGLDFIIWNAHKFTVDANAGWCGGDFNADGFVDGADFVIWYSHKFQSSMRPQRVSAGTGTVSGIKWEDLANFGVRDPGEPGVAGVRIYVDLNSNGDWDNNDDAPEPSAVTAADGSYLITNIPLGYWNIAEVVPNGWEVTYPDEGVHLQVTVDPTATETNFGNRRLPSPGSIHGQKWHDLDGDGRRDQNEPGLDGWTIELVDALTQAVTQSQVTHSADLNMDGMIDDITERGLYWLEDVPAGDYYVREVPQDGWLQTSPSADVQISGYAIADNWLQAFVGDRSASSLRPISSIVAGPNAQPLTLQAATRDEYLYFTAWSDDAVLQGLLADLTFDADSVSNLWTGDPAIQVCATGEDHDTPLGPSTSNVARHISACEASGGWTQPAVGPFNATGFPGLVPPVPLINLEANWIWYDSGRQPGTTAPFQPGFDHDEYLIFRIPVPSRSNDYFVQVDGSAVTQIDFGNARVTYLPDGDDTIHGLDGDDDLHGDHLIDPERHPLVVSTGSRRDRLYGGRGKDRLDGQQADDLLSGGEGHDVLHGGEGVDWLEQDFDLNQSLLTNGLVTTATAGTISVDLAYTIEHARLIGGPSPNDLDARGFTVGSVELYGKGGDDRDLWGTDFADLLVGGDGSDVLMGGLGDDRYQFGAVTTSTAESDHIIELAGGGIDTVDFGQLPASDLVFVDLNTPPALAAAIRRGP